ncbi:Uncharacterized protein dnm_067380 [Desulfonema magnum]|uniref:Uncharacterized protein n=1 Tax=Desulfonema magnum TaxID=45655 RepID=A0A975BS49_9BACT|nr:Uncharacterized protein dnm_067380 [Desulfonema magnum]
MAEKRTPYDIKTRKSLVPGFSLTPIKLSFRSAKIIFRIPVGNSFCHPGCSLT